MSDKPSYTYYPTVSYDIQDIYRSYVAERLVQLMYEQATSSIIEVELKNHPGVKVFAAGTGKAQPPSGDALIRFEEQAVEAAKILDSVDGIRQLFSEGKGAGLLKRATSADRTDEECLDIVDSLENGLVDNIQIFDKGKLLVSLEEGDWTV